MNPLEQALQDGQEIKMHYCSTGPSKVYTVYIYGDCHIEVADADFAMAQQRAAGAYQRWLREND